MSLLEWRRSDAAKIADGLTDTYVIATGHGQTVLTRYASDGTPGSWWVATQAAWNAITLACPVPDGDAVNLVRLRRLAQAYEVGLDIPEYAAWRRQ